MEVITEQQILEFVGQYIWPLIRISGVLLAMPLIGARVVPARVRLALAFVLAVLVSPLLPPVPNDVPLLSLSMLNIGVQQLLIGLAMGFSLQVFMQIFVLAGQVIAGKLGLGFAAMNDPSTGVSVPLISQFYSITVTLLFFSVDAHLLVIEALAASFYSIPIGPTGLDRQALLMIVGLGSWMFSSSLVIALPLLTALLVVNLAFGVMSRAAPQMNVFAVGFPLTLVFGLLLMWLSLVSFLPNFNTFMYEALQFMQNLLQNP
ncbi:flagellar biosynthetic protein FliR [Pseudoteredinibacter isoporae]|uniref:Flagellar biosynthetic protein FliR n=1 Tax=Pseudoteredinibacter isoporae TaxID=570281 RepID=A0A7X0JY99_9GAMM|nr:flagellar biosynthetic protein FliR [Pseudoteredinibacter isoporae]NHO88970.1 flagellar biosynthetic protein FliR [Pseudoteredinibacter isoporae]NIB24322.1 flagellar biosynthetic protein FliR [Pseudoteredinibacter isoporae]